MENWLKQTKTFMVNWYEDFKDVTTHSFFFPLTTEEATTFSKLIFNERLTEEDKENMNYFAKKIQPAFDKFNHKVFVRTDIRSPKDSDYFYEEIKPITDSLMAIKIMLSSERIWVDFKRANDNDFIPTLVVREWFDFQPDREFRCFVRDGQLFAITQYSYSYYYEWIDSNKDFIKNEITSLFEKIKDRLPDKDIVFDLHISDKETRLIEFNPYDMSDTCCFEDYGALNAIYRSFNGEIVFEYETKEKIEARDQQRNLSNFDFDSLSNKLQVLSFKNKI